MMTNSFSNEFMINLYLDGQLSKEEEMQFLSEADSNPVIQNSLSKERVFRNFIKSHTPKSMVSQDLILRIKQNLAIRQMPNH